MKPALSSRRHSQNVTHLSCEHQAGRMHLCTHTLDAQEVLHNMPQLTLLSASPLLVAHAVDVFMVALGCACPFN